MDTRLFAFVGADIGPWRIVRAETRVGEPLPEAKRLNVVSASELQSETNAPWILRGITSNERYVMRAEKNEIVAKQQGLARPEATCGALIPIRKNAAWWELTQDERRSVFEQSKHVQIGLRCALDWGGRTMKLRPNSPHGVPVWRARREGCLDARSAARPCRCVGLHRSRQSARGGPDG